LVCCNIATLLTPTCCSLIRAAKPVTFLCRGLLESIVVDALIFGHIVDIFG